MPLLLARDDVVLWVDAANDRLYRIHMSLNGFETTVGAHVDTTFLAYREAGVAAGHPVELWEIEGAGHAFNPAANAIDFYESLEGMRVTVDDPIAVGPTSSGVALAMLPVAEEYKKILLVEPAVADSITGDKWNKYIFRTGRNSSQDAISNAVALDKPNTVIATLAQDYAFGRDGVKAFKEAIKTAKIVHEEYLPQATTDFTAGAQRLIDKLKDQPGRKIIWIIWAGGGNPFKIADLDLKRYNIEIATGGNILPAMAAYKQFPGMEGATYYYFGIPKNPVNEALVAQHYKEFKAPPDFFTAGGFAAAMAVATALKKTNGDTNTNKLISTMEGMSFDTPKGTMTFRKDDHQAMQSMYHFKINVDPAFAWGVPELVKEIKASEMEVPIRNKR